MVRGYPFAMYVNNRGMVNWPAAHPTLTDGDVTLRAWREEDADAAYQACQDVDIQRYTRVPVPYLREHAQFFVDRFQHDNWSSQTGIGFAITSAGDDAVLGACGLIGLDNQEARSGVGYWVAPSARGRGVATRGLSLLADWGLSGLLLREIYAEVEVENRASMRAAERAGFRAHQEEPRWEEHRGAPRLFLTLVRSRGD